MANDEEKTEEATPQKLGEARDKGDVPHSKEFSNFIIFAGLCLTIYFAARTLFDQNVRLIKKYFDFRTYPLENVQDFMVVIKAIIHDILTMVGPIFIVCFILGIAAHVVQFGFIFTTEKLSPDFDKLNPMNGFKRIFSRETGVDFIKSNLKIWCIGFILFLVLRGEFTKLTQLGDQPIGFIFIYFVKMIAKSTFVILIFMGLLGLLDFAYQKWSYAEKMKMSLQEIKDENKQREGDPHIKARIRQLQRERARKRMMEKVPSADVIVTNPTHVAVALKYEKGAMRAPVVVAKGAGFIAVKIKEIAALNEVPILEKKQLARFLYKNVEVSETIPESLYTAVAEILAYVYKVKKKFNELVKRPA